MYVRNSSSNVCLFENQKNYLQTSPKKLIDQRSEDDVITLIEQNIPFADFSKFSGSGDKEVDDEELHNAEELPRMHGAFQIYRKQTSK